MKYSMFRYDTVEVDNGLLYRQPCRSAYVCLLTELSPLECLVIIYFSLQIILEGLIRRRVHLQNKTSARLISTTLINSRLALICQHSNWLSSKKTNDNLHISFKSQFLSKVKSHTGLRLRLSTVRVLVTRLCINSS